MISVVTGSHGFIGEHLVRKLERSGHTVIRLERTAIPPKQFDYFFHLAAYGNHRSQQDIEEMKRANIDRTWELLRDSMDVPYVAFVNLSTSSVTLPVQTMYSATKHAGEHLCEAFVNKYDIPVISVRPSSVTGTGEQNFHLIPTLIRSCLNGEKMPFVGDSTHDYIDVEDLIDGLLVIIKNRKKGETYNISNNRKWSNEEVKQMVEKSVGKKANIKRVKSLREYDNDNWKIDNFKLLELGWKPKISLEKSILSMV